MSLNFDLSAIPLDVRTVEATEDNPSQGIKAGERIMSPVTNALIWSTVSIGVGEINDDTLDEFAARIDVLQKLHGALVVANIDGEWVDRLLTRSDVEAHKGLKTNVFPMETRAKWVTRMVTKSHDLFPKPEPKSKR